MRAEDFVEALVKLGWTREVDEDARNMDLRELVLPKDVDLLSRGYSLLSNARDTSWFYSRADYAGASDSGFEWDFFRKNSLECALDVVQAEAVRKFWSEHFPFAASVADGYAYLAMRLSDGAIVFGDEPEYEASARVIAGSMSDFFWAFIACAQAGESAEIARFL